MLAKVPQAGRVKTRLACEIGPVAASWWYRHQLLRLLRRLRDPRWQLVLAVAPDRAVGDPALPAGLPRIPQGQGDLGTRMERALAAQPPGPALLVGGDIPGLGPAHVARAFALLGRHEAVLGPAEDGGFWGIGLRRGAQAAPRPLFAGVRWSVPDTLAETRAALAPLSVGLADRLPDVDSLADLRRTHSA
ncbi:TIGR04282 family arsenosugar biosynthesis glycosyltransferase [Paralimibaculum aggregatum]|uniref:TIGR04282 family arsenosugar biosynthesis glycosyltransferase n=1 Tax=Paralimibaculum aggregatum TaxID=3036245 RepID=A0ABQ6LRB5_9RHOB|nr:TIGR04282 family arsenosugar biosynthesis glycosyltransferase [Limibaculum sp. NKW23]